MRSHFNRWLAPMVVLVGLVISGCSNDGKPLTSLDPQSRQARDIDRLSDGIFIAAGVVFVFVMGAVLYLVFKNRVPAPGPGEEEFPGEYADEDFPEQTHGNTKAEIGWTIAPAVILAVVAVFTVPAIYAMDDVDAAPAGRDQVAVTVVGQQWWWEYQYHLDGNTDTSPDFVTATDLVIPTGQDVPLTITSRDVIHSHWIPALHGKRDAVPGRMHPWVISADDPGRYAGTCTEFCGLSHAYMRMFTEAMTPADFDAWVENQMRPAGPVVDPAEQRGETLFAAQCASCHVVNGLTSRDRDGDGQPEADDASLYPGRADMERGVLMPGYTDSLLAGAAPNLTHFMSRQWYAGGLLELYNEDGSVNVSDLEAWLRNPADIKPNAAGERRGMPNLGLDEAQIDDLVAYLTTLD